MLKFRQVFKSYDFERAEAVLNTNYSPHRMIALGPPSDFHVFHGFSDAGGLSLHGLSYGADLRAFTEPFKNYYLLTRVQRGGYRIKSGTQERELGPGDTAILDPFRDYVMDFKGNCEVQQLRLERQLFDSALANWLPHASNRPITYDLTKQISHRHHLRRINVLQLVTDELLVDEAGSLSSMMRDQVALLAAAAFLDDPSCRHVLGEGQEMPRRTVLEALSFIEENCEKDINLHDIVDAVGGSARGLQNAFKKELQTTPLAQLKEVRLRRAYQELKSGAAAVSVTDVALKWGFNNLGRFSADFYKLFNKLPREILRG